MCQSVCVLARPKGCWLGSVNVLHVRLQGGSEHGQDAHNLQRDLCVCHSVSLMESKEWGGGSHPMDPSGWG